MTPLAGNRVRACKNTAADTNAAADAGARDDAEDNVAAGGGAITRFRQRKAIRVVGDAHVTAECHAQILVERVADQARGVGVLHEAGDGADRAGDSNAHGTARVQFASTPTTRSRMVRITSS